MLHARSGAGVPLNPAYHLDAVNYSDAFPAVAVSACVALAAGFGLNRDPLK